MRILFVLAFISTIQVAFTQSGKPIVVQPAVDGITVYLNGGEVRSSAELDLAVGTNTVVLKGLSPHTFPQSVQVGMKGDVEILSVSTAGDYLDAGELEPRINVLKDSLDLMRERIAELDDRIAASEAERSMLASNHDIGGNGVVVSAEQLAQAADFFRERTLQVNRAISRLKGEQTDLLESRRRAERQLAELNYRHNPDRQQVTVVLMSAKAQQARIDLRHLVANTGWSPVYDLVAKDISQPIALRYKAQVYNNTGVDWSRVKLTLSTADPSLGATRPVLSKWTIGAPEASADRGGRYGVSGQMRTVEFKPQAPGLLNADSTQRYTTVAVAEVSAEFPITRAYDIPSDAKPYLVEIAEHTVPADYAYLAVPKLDKDAFLIARITGWEKLNLVDGKANVYYGDAYVGESMIRTATTDDTLDLSLGRDNNVRISRVKQEDRTSHKIMGSERKATMAFEITVKNNGTSPVKLTVIDQVPVSQDTEIKVDVTELSGGQLDAREGSVEWLAELEPGATRKYELAFTIRYPKERQVEVRRLRAVSCPTF